MYYLGAGLQDKDTSNERWERWNEIPQGHGYAAEEDGYYEEDWDYVDDYDENAFYEENEGNDYLETELYDDPFPYEQEATFYETDFGEPADEEDPQLEEAYAAYLDARRQFANIKAARGYYPVVAMVPGGDSPSAQSPFSRPSKGGK